jgi:hypothetical protein
LVLLPQSQQQPPKRPEKRMGAEKAGTRKNKDNGSRKSAEPELNGISAEADQSLMVITARSSNTLKGI